MGFTAEHANGTYRDHETFVGPPAQGGSISWPDAMGALYPVVQCAAMLAIRAELVPLMAQYQPTLISIEFL